VSGTRVERCACCHARRRPVLTGTDLVKGVYAEGTIATMRILSGKDTRCVASETEAT
jgi:hypothetical protein